jgi:hypothetical protein
MIVGERILPDSDPVMQRVSWPRIVGTVRLSGKKFALGRFEAREQGAPERCRKVVEGSETGTLKGMSIQALSLLFGCMLNFSHNV